MIDEMESRKMFMFVVCENKKTRDTIEGTYTTKFNIYITKFMSSKSNEFSK
jgi:hypothetical protein